MTMEETIITHLRALPPDKQHEVCDFAEFLHERSHAGRPLKDPEGIWKGRCADITLDEIKEVRREMWGNFPREVAR